jgi:tetratricopeptide (TPR) repeat protein
VRGELAGPRARPARAHLRAGCEVCRAAIAPALVPWMDAAAAEVLRRDPLAALGPLRAECERAVADVLAARRPAAGLRGRDPRVERAVAVLADRGLRGLVLLRRPLAGDVAVEALLRSSWDLRFDDPRRMFDHAEHAGVIAETLDAGCVGAARANDLRCRAAAETANARRVLGQHAAAQSALDTAMEQFHRGARDPLVAARIFEIQARLLGDQGHRRAAAAVLDDARAIYRHHRRPVAMAQVLVSRAIYAAEAGEPQSAEDSSRDALLLVGPRRAPTVTLAAVQNLGMLLTEAGRWRAARALLWRSRGLWPARGRLSLVARLHWLQAKIAVAAGDLDGAEREFAATREGLLRFGDAYGACLVELDHGATLEAAGLVERGRALAAAAAAGFLGLDLPREPAVAMQLLQTSLRFHATAPAMPLGDVVRFMHAAQGNPQARLQTYLA